MTEPEKKWGAAADSPAEQTPEEARSALPDTDPPSPGEKASTAPTSQFEGCAEDTIDGGDGSYLEPPD